MGLWPRSWYLQEPGGCWQGQTQSVFKSCENAEEGAGIEQRGVVWHHELVGNLYKGIAKVQIEVDQLAGSPAEPQAGPRDRWPRNRTLLKQKQNPLTTLAVCLLELQNSSKPLTPGNRRFLWPKTPWERLGCFISLATVTWSWICQARYMVRNASNVIRRKGLLWRLNLSTLVT